MTRKPTTPAAGRKPVLPMGLRERTRADGSVRLWWEPRGDAAKLGFAAVDLDANRMAWSRQQAERLNAEVEAARLNGSRKSAKARKTSRSIDDLISDYRASPHFKATLAAKTRDSYGKLLIQISDKWGPHRAAAFDKATMKAWYQTLFTAKGARMAQALIRMMSVLMTHAEDLGWRPENSNPCFRLKVVTPDPRARAGAAAELAAILSAADALELKGMGLAIRLALYQGQRQTDIRLATRGAFQLRTLPGQGKAAQVWVWQLRRSKRGTEGAMQLHPAVVPMLRAALADAGTARAPRGPADPLIYDEVTGKSYTTEFLFNKRWLAIRAWAAHPEGGNCPGVGDLQFRDLRRTFGVLARAGGASKDDIGDVLGNSAAVNPLLGETYMPASFTSASRAVAAVKLPKAGRKAK